MAWSGTTLAVALSVASAFAYALGAVLQQRHAGRGVRGLVRTPLWWAAIGLNGAGAALHVVALPYGPLTLVQAFGVLTLALAVPLGAMANHRRTTGTERLATALIVAGLLGLLLLIGSGTGAGALSTVQTTGLLLACAVVLTLVGVRGSGLRLAVGSGVAFGVSSAVSQTITVHVAAGGAGVLLQPGGIAQVLAVAALSTTGLLFAQRSYRSGLGAPLAVSTLTNPVAAAAIGVLLLGEHVTTDGAGVGLVVLAATAAALGVHLLTVHPQAPALPALAAAPG
jgi:drug/metabolite transporter (DMT)-like permease